MERLTLAEDFTVNDIKMINALQGSMHYKGNSS
jgi:NRPS condensation-like uncharacterized protein